MLTASGIRTAKPAPILEDDDGTDAASDRCTASPPLSVPSVLVTLSAFSSAVSSGCWPLQRTPWQELCQRRRGRFCRPFSAAITSGHNHQQQHRSTVLHSCRAGAAQAYLATFRAFAAAMYAATSKTESAVSHTSTEETRCRRASS